MTTPREGNAMSRYRAEIERDIATWSERRADLRARLERAELESRASVPEIKRKLAPVEAGLKAARARLRAYDDQDHAGIEAEIKRLRAEATRENVEEGCKPVREKLMRATMLRLEAFLEMREIEDFMFSRLRQVQVLEGKLRGVATQPVDFLQRSNIVGPLNATKDVAAEDLMRELQSLAENPGDSELSQKLKLDEYGRVATVSGHDVRAVIRFALGAY